MVTTRSSTPLTDENSNCSVDANGKLPISDPSKAVKVYICPKTAISSPILHLPNPKNDSPSLYIVDGENCGEVVQSPNEYRSWFYGEDVVEDGAFRLYSPVHPIFLVLPYLLKNKGKFMELSDILVDEKFPSISSLEQNKQLLKTLSLVSDTQDICDIIVYRFSQEKTLEWMKTRLNKIKEALTAEGSLHKAIINNEEAFDRYSFGMLCDYLPAELIPDIKIYLGIVDAVVAIEEKVESYKRKTDEDEFLYGKTVVKKVKESTVKKQLAQASKGTVNISSFFKKK